MLSGKGEPKLAKWISIIAALALFGGGSFAYGLYSGAKETGLFNAAKRFEQIAKEAVSQLRQNVSNRPEEFLQPARFEGSGVVKNDVTDQDLVMIAGFFDGDNGVRLLRRDGTVVAAWRLTFSDYVPDPSYLGEDAPATDWNVDLHGTLLNPDGSLVTNFEYAALVKLDRCGRLDWILEQPTHHSVERSELGGYWVPGRRFTNGKGPEASFPPLTDMSGEHRYKEDEILHVTEDGQIDKTVSVPRILYDSGLAPVLSATGIRYLPGREWSDEIVHVNKIAELPAALAPAFPMFEAGDLAISIREYNLVAVIDPDTWKVKWHQTGPWVRQHDPEFIADGTIAVFNNNTYATRVGAYNRTSPNDPRVSDVMAVNPATGNTTIPFAAEDGEGMLSVVRSKIDPVTDGGYLITEFEAGRALQTDRAGRIVWEYINRYDTEFVAEITEARLYPADYFTVDDWSCAQ